MTANSDYADMLIAKLKPLPSIAAKAVGKAMYSTVLNQTLQDSGVAAYNWRANINNTQRREFQDSRGRAPVGSSGDKRSAGMDRFIVIHERYSDFLSRLRGKDVKTLKIYNPIEDPAHEIRSFISSAGTMATGEFTEDVAKRVVDLHMAGRLNHADL